MNISGVNFTGGFVVSPAVDNQFNYVTALLHGDGASAGTNNTFLDSSTNNFSITRTGNVTQGSYAPYSTLWSNYLNGSSYLQTQAFNAACTGDFTFECWAYIVTYGSTSAFFTIGDEAAGRYYFALTGSGGQLWSNQYGGANFTWGTATSVLLNRWTHIAWVRVGTTVTGYVNGISVGTQTISGTVGNSGGITIGANPAGGYLWTGYLSNVRIINGTALYTSTFTPSTTPLTAITNTSLLTCQSNRFKDNSTNNLTITPTATPSVQVFSPFGTTTQYDPATIGGSLYIPSSSDYLSYNPGSTAAFGTGDFTVEVWAYATSALTSGANPYICDTRGGGGVWSFGWNWSGGASPWQLSWGSTSTALQSSTSMVINSWNHCVYVRSGTTGTLYLNGVSIGTWTDSTDYSASVTSMTIGRRYTLTSGTQYFPGNLSNLRIVKGTAVYTSAFTPPSAPLTAITNTQLLLNFTNAQIFDNAMMNNLVTVGNAQVSTSIYKYGTGSMYFNGTTGYLAAPNSPNFNFGTGDFTVEFWMNATAAGTFVAVVGTQSIAGASTAGMWRISNRINSVNGIYFNYTTGSAFTDLTFSTTNYNDGAWHHIAACRASGTLRMFVDGVSVGTPTVLSQSLTSNQALYVGYQAQDSAYYTGYVDELRISKVARYTSNFTAPTSQFPSTGPIPITTPNVEYLVVAGGGGGGGGNGGGGGGGAGGVLTSSLSVSASVSYTVTVGAGATTSTAQGNPGNNSVFSSITALKGGGGGANSSGTGGAGTFGSGGGAGCFNAAQVGGVGTTGQGTNGGIGANNAGFLGGGGGGGAGTSGSNGTSAGGGNGGNGVTSSITGVSTAYGAGGGGGKSSSGTIGLGGSSLLGGSGGGTSGGSGGTGTNGTVNSGSGGGGGSDGNVAGGAGGSGIVIIRYPSTFSLASSTTGNPTVTTTGGYNIYTWTSSGSITF